MPRSYIDANFFEHGEQSIKKDSPKIRGAMFKKKRDKSSKSKAAANRDQRKRRGSDIDINYVPGFPGVREGSSSDSSSTKVDAELADDIPLTQGNASKRSTADSSTRTGWVRRRTTKKSSPADVKTNRSRGSLSLAAAQMVLGLAVPGPSLIARTKSRHGYKKLLSNGDMNKGDESPLSTRTPKQKFKSALSTAAPKYFLATKDGANGLSSQSPEPARSKAKLKGEQKSMQGLSQLPDNEAAWETGPSPNLSLHAKSGRSNFEFDVHLPQGLSEYSRAWLTDQNDVPSQFEPAPEVKSPSQLMTIGNGVGAEPPHSSSIVLDWLSPLPSKAETSFSSRHGPSTESLNNMYKSWSQSNHARSRSELAFDATPSNVPGVELALGTDGLASHVTSSGDKPHIDIRTNSNMDAHPMETLNILVSSEREHWEEQTAQPSEELWDLDFPSLHPEDSASNISIRHRAVGSSFNEGNPETASDYSSLTSVGDVRFYGSLRSSAMEGRTAENDRMSTTRSHASRLTAINYDPTMLNSFQGTFSSMSLDPTRPYRLNVKVADEMW